MRNGDQFPNFFKRGNQYTTIQTSCYNLLDCLKFTSPCRYADYLKQWNIKESKGVFPYELYNSVENIMNATEFPTHAEFYSRLTCSNISLDDYNWARNEYNRRYALPEGHVEKMSSMMDWLKWYNLQDVEPLVKAMERSFKCFYDYFEQDASTFLSLPGIAEKALYRNFDPGCSYIYSFLQKDNDIRALHRAKINGGIVNIFHRNVYIKVKYNLYMFFYI